jgi:hypothetical protein
MDVVVGMQTKMAGPVNLPRDELSSCPCARPVAKQ